VSVNSRRHNQKENPENSRRQQRKHDIGMRSIQTAQSRNLPRNSHQFFGETRQHYACESHEPLNNRIQEQKRNWQSNHSKDDKKELSVRGQRTHVSVSDRGQHRAGIKHGLTEAPVLLASDIPGGWYALVI